jgi:hypothetical protein
MGVFMQSNTLFRMMSLALLTGSFLLAQEPTAQITGLITDPTGGAVPTARIELVNSGTGLRYEAQSNDSGNYVYSNLPTGTYQVTVHKDGFSAVTRSGIVLAVSQVARLDFTLQLGSTTQTVEIHGTAPLLENSTASLGQLVEARAVSDLPLNGRNFLQLAKLSTGVLEPKQGDRASTGGSFIANGVRAQLNNFLLDGVDNNAKIVDQQNSSPVVIQPSVDAVQEFRVETNNYSAEYGYSAGAVVNAVIKGGTNALHGTAFEFVRNSAMDARNYFATAGTQKPILQQHQFGGTLGGPIVKNRAFLFGSFERTSINRGNTYVVTVPTAAQRTGDLSGLGQLYDPSTTVPAGAGVYSRSIFANNQIPVGRIDPAASKLLAALPLPNVAGKTINNYVTSPAITNRANRFDFRHDFQISEKDSLFARYSYFTGDLVTPGPFPAPLIGSTTFQTAPKSDLGNGAALGETHTFLPNLVNEFRLGYNRIQDFLTPFVTDNVNSQFGLNGIPVTPGVTGLPSIAISGYANLGEATFLPNKKISETITAEDHVSWTLGTHSLKIGGSYRWVRSWFDISSSARGSYTFSGAFTQNPQKPAGTGSGLADFLLGIPAGSTLSNRINGDLRYNYAGGFVQDDWKLTPRLTLNLGVRYELWTQPVERHDQQANFLINTGKLIFANNQVPPGVSPAIVANIPDGLGDRSLMKTDKNNFAPRVGLAYQATQSTVIRSGFGVFFADDPAIGASARLVANPPYYQNVSYQTDQITPLLSLSGGFPPNALGQNVNLSTASLSGFAADMKQAYVFHWSFGIQQQLRNFLFEANYVGTKGNDLVTTYNINSPLAGPGSVASRRRYQGLGDINYSSPLDASSYNAMELRVERRYSSGFSLLGSYTLSKTIDIGGESLIGDLSLRNAQNVAAERSLSSGDMRHRFVASALYDIPFGQGRHFSSSSRVLNAIAGDWQVNAIVTMHTGQPFTPALGTSTANTGAARPNRIADGNLTSDQRSVNNWFDKSAFAAPALYNFGNAGRNILIGPGASNLDLSVFKNFPLRFLGEGRQLQFRAEAFNILNHPQFSIPSSANTPRVDIPQGGVLTSLANDMRELQLALKVVF